MHRRFNTEDRIQFFSYLLLYNQKTFVGNQIAFGDNRHRCADSHRFQDEGVVAALLHPSIIGGDAEESAIKRPDSADHIADEACMTGHVDDPDYISLSVYIGSEPQLDRTIAFLLFGESIGVGCGQRLYQSRFAMVHMAGGSNDVH